ncbi:MAG: PIG-L family deacetylase [SAR202 cluster bacterium]|nr:PIG-L family deacetylase [SAR202 cluster bacterium]
MSEANQEKPHSKAMVVMAHADDAEFSCSGTVAKWCREGWEVVYVLCTDGSKGSDDLEMTPEKLAAIRKQEQIEAGKILGIKTVEFLDYPDSYLTPSLDLRKDIARVIRKHKPDVLICPSPFRSFDNNSYIGHPDHMAAGEAALAAVYPTARDRLTYPDLIKEGLEPHKVKEVWITMGGGAANHWVELTEEHLELSMKALKAHVSQVPPDVDSRMREWKARAGSLRGLRYAEAFRVFKLRG